MVGQTSPEFFNYIPVFLLASLQRLSSHLEPGNICSGDSGDLRRRTVSPRAKDTDSSTRRGEKGMTGGLVGANNHADTCMHTHTQKGEPLPPCHNTDLGPLGDMEASISASTQSCKSVLTTRENMLRGIQQLGLKMTMK